MTQAFNLSQFANKVNTSGQADLTTAVTGTLPVANGGTGLSSPGASGNVLQSNGTSWVSAAIGDYVGGRGQAFTSSGTFTIPSGITAVKVTVVAGGGAGGGVSGTADTRAGGGGGAGGMAIKYLTSLTPGNTLAVTVGAAAASSSVASGTQTISTISATAGSAGSAGSRDDCVYGGAGGAGSGGDVNITGLAGQNSLCIARSDAASASGIGGFGGSSAFGSGGRGGNSAAGSAATGYGAGGGGSGRTGSNATIAGGAAVGGIVIFEW